MGLFSVFTVFVVVIYVFGAVDKTSSSFSAHGIIGNFIIIKKINCSTALVNTQPSRCNVTNSNVLYHKTSSFVCYKIVFLNCSVLSVVHCWKICALQQCQIFYHNTIIVVGTVCLRKQKRCSTVSQAYFVHLSSTHAELVEDADDKLFLQVL